MWLENKTDGDQYYEFIMVYKDYLLAISQDTVSEISEVAEKLKI